MLGFLGFGVVGRLVDMGVVGRELVGEAVKEVVSAMVVEIVGGGGRGASSSCWMLGMLTALAPAGEGGGYEGARLLETTRSCRSLLNLFAGAPRGFPEDAAASEGMEGGDSLLGIEDLRSLSKLDEEPVKKVLIRREAIMVEQYG